MLYRIRKPGLALYSTGGEVPQWKANGKIWSSLSAFAGHLALKTLHDDKMERQPTSLFKLYGDCVVVEIPENGIGATTETPFKQWYDKYFDTSEKFRAARKAEKSKAADAAARLTAEPVMVRKPKGWDVPTKTTIKRALEQSSKFVPNLKFINFGEHARTGESFAVVEISGKSYALLEL